MPRLLDLFCGAGGAAVGYHRAGFDVVGVDIVPQPRYPFEFVQADAMSYPLDGFDAIHASPPCQDHSSLATRHPSRGTGWMLAAMLRRLAAQHRPWIVENVVGADMGRAWSVLCGSSFGLPIRRHRRFAASFVILVPGCQHRGPIVGVYGHSGAQRGPRKVNGRAAADALGIDWTTDQASLTQMVPPAYTEHIGRQLLPAVGVAVT